MADAETPLAVAVRNDDYDEVVNLLRAGADPNVPDVVGETPLFEAAVSGNVDIIAVLLLNAADASQRSQTDMVAQDLAHNPVAQLLLRMFTGKDDVDSEQVNTVYKHLNAEMVRQVSQRMMELTLKRDKQQSFYSPEQAAKAKEQRQEEAATIYDQHQQEKAAATLEINKHPPHGNSYDDEAAKNLEKLPSNPVQDEKLTSTTLQDEITSTTADGVTSAQPFKLSYGEVSSDELLQATQDGNLAKVLQLLEQGADPNECDSVGETSLFEAAASSYLDILAALLLHRADPLKKSNCGLIAENLAADDQVKVLIQLFQDDVAVEPKAAGAALTSLSKDIRRSVEEHLSKGRASSFVLQAIEAAGVADARKTDPSRSTFDYGSLSVNDRLITAVRNGDLTMLLQLLREGANPNIDDEIGEPLLFEAVTAGNHDMVAGLLLGHADPNKKTPGGMVPSDVAADQNVRTLIKLFRDEEVDPDDELACLEELTDDMRECVKVHLENLQWEVAKAITSSQSRPVPSLFQFQPESRLRESNVFELQLPDPSSRESNVSALQYSLAGRRSAMPENPISAEPEDPALEEGDAPLTIAVRNDDLSEVCMLLQQGADPNECDAIGETPLFEAAVRGLPNVIATLLLSAADPCITNLSNQVARYLADDAATKSLLLLFEGAEVDAISRAHALQVLDIPVRQQVCMELQARANMAEYQQARRHNELGTEKKTAFDAARAKMAAEERRGIESDAKLQAAGEAWKAREMSNKERFSLFSGKKLPPGESPPGSLSSTPAPITAPTQELPDKDATKNAGSIEDKAATTDSLTRMTSAVSKEIEDGIAQDLAQSEAAPVEDHSLQQTVECLQESRTIACKTAAAVEEHTVQQPVKSSQEYMNVTQNLEPVQALQESMKDAQIAAAAVEEYSPHQPVESSQEFINLAQTMANAVEDHDLQPVQPSQESVNTACSVAAARGEHPLQQPSDSSQEPVNLARSLAAAVEADSPQKPVQSSPDVCLASGLAATVEADSPQKPLQSSREPVNFASRVAASVERSLQSSPERQSLRSTVALAATEHVLQQAVQSSQESVNDACITAAAVEGLSAQQPMESSQEPVNLNRSLTAAVEEHSPEHPPEQQMESVNTTCSVAAAGDKHPLQQPVEALQEVRVNLACRLAAAGEERSLQQQGELSQESLQNACTSTAEGEEHSLQQLVQSSQEPPHVGHTVAAVMEEQFMQHSIHTARSVSVTVEEHPLHQVVQSSRESVHTAPSGAPKVQEHPLQQPVLSMQESINTGHIVAAAVEEHFPQQPVPSLQESLNTDHIVAAAVEEHSLEQPAEFVTIASGMAAVVKERILQRPVDPLQKSIDPDEHSLHQPVQSLQESVSVDRSLETAAEEHPLQESVNIEGVPPGVAADITTPVTEETGSIEAVVPANLPVPQPLPLLEPMPSPEPALSPESSIGLAPTSISEPAAEPAPRGEGIGEHYVVVRGPILAVRRSPCMTGEVEVRINLGDIVELGEKDASGDWQRVISIVQGKEAGTRPAEGWVPLKHPIFGRLLAPHQRAFSEAARMPALAALSEARRRLQQEHPNSIRQAHPATKALLEIFRTGRVSDPEQQRSLSKLDPRTVRCVLAASLQHLRENGLKVYMQSYPRPPDGSVAPSQMRGVHD